MLYPRKRVLQSLRCLSRCRPFTSTIALVALMGPVACLSPTRAGDRLSNVAEFVENHCLDCHTGDDSERGFDLEGFAKSWTGHGNSEQTIEAWEKALLRIQSRQMPPADAGQPDESEYQEVEAAIRQLLDQHAQEHPHAGQAAPLRRMTRTEYKNAIRDLLKIEIDAEGILPPDSSSDGFDNITVAELSPLLMERYLTAASRISRDVVGTGISKPGGVTVRVPADQSQERHVDGLPFGTRGGSVVQHHFPVGGQYEVQVRLTRDRDGRVEGISGTNELDVLVDRERMQRFQLGPVRGTGGHSRYDLHLNVRINVSAGTHKVGATFVERSSSLQEIKRQPFDASFNRHRHPRRTPAVHEISIVGPFPSEDGLSELDAESASRRAVFVARPSSTLTPEKAATRIFTHLTRQAYRRPITADDLVVPMRFFYDAYSRESDGEASANFDAGIEAGLTSILVNPNFLFRSIGQPSDVEPGMVYPISSIELASRLSFFLWSSVPDENLLSLAQSDELHRDDVIDAEVRRMLSDARSESLVDSFADQWLYLRNLPTITPDLRKFPSFDNNLRQAFAEETKHLFADVVNRDASVLELIRSDHTFLNDRLAMHYGIPGVIGSHFRRVDLDPQWHRGGLLRHGSVLMATSYATRTSPTIRGAWVLENILGTPPPPPPPNVPTIKEKSSAAPLSFRDMLAKHREDTACASCHDLIDPVGFALDRYDAVGRWRRTVEGMPVDAQGRLPDGKKVDGVAELEQGILDRPELFVMALTEKLMTYAIGRPIKEADGAEVRRIVQQASENGYRFSDLVSGIARSTPFRMRTSQ